MKISHFRIDLFGYLDFMGLDSHFLLTDGFGQKL